ncbi:MAG: DUF3021 family protein [Lachnospiraceae bacterium]|nr:DUF3021 family protein [Lachnospiraceae bacterium]
MREVKTEITHKVPLAKRLLRALATEVDIELKACLYFFCILFYYSMYRLGIGSDNALLLHMAEMILVVYVMGYVQYFLMERFDQGEHFGTREILYMLVCVAVHIGVSILCNWYDKNLWVTVGFAAYLLVVYFSVYLVYKVLRMKDGKELNEDLRAFQERRER